MSRMHQNPQDNLIQPVIHSLHDYSIDERTLKHLQLIELVKDDGAAGAAGAGAAGAAGAGAGAAGGH